MGSYIIKRLLLAIPTLIGVVTLVFFSIRLAPGNPIQMMIPTGLPAAQETAVVHHIQQEYGFNKPLYVQYLDYMDNVAHFKFGNSLLTNRPIVPDLVQDGGNTLQLGFLALLVSVLLGVPAGIVAATHRNTWIDHLTMSVSLAGISVPDFVMGFTLMLLFGLTWGILPPSGFGGVIWTVAGFKYVILPAFTLGFSGAGVLARFTRSSVLEVLYNDYVRTARAKGLLQRVVVYRHVLKNALIPVVTVLGLQFGSVLSGAVIVETVFSWPGLGRFMYNAISGRDFPVVQAAVIVIAFGFVFGNLLTDLAYGLIDPRIRYD